MSPEVSRVKVVIPARAGSVGIKNKNLQKVGGRSLLKRAIDAGLELTDEVYVTSENRGYLDRAEMAGAKVINRSPIFAKDNSRSEEAIKEVIEVMEWEKSDIIVFLQATSPFRPKGELLKALTHLYYNHFDSLYSAYRLYPFVWTQDGKRVQYKVGHRPTRQKKDALYVEDGSFYISYVDVYLNYNNRLGGNIGRFVHDKVYGVEIDTYSDLHFARSVLLTGEGDELV